MEQWNQDTIEIDEVSTIEMVTMFNREDEKVAAAVGKCTGVISSAIDIIVEQMVKGGRLFYIGSGSGGKLGLLDATECPPTFGTDDNTVIGLISGGEEALSGWREDTEDDEGLAIKDLKAKGFGGHDVLVGISASGNTPYVISAVSYAKDMGNKTIGICCSLSGRLEHIADVCVVMDVGPEVIMGSTRLKAGTAQKMVLNMLSSCAMIKLGKTYHNLMVDVRPINRKLKQRVLDIITLATGKGEALAQQALTKAKGNAKLAILMLTLNINATIADALLKKHNGYLKKAIKDEA
ncbi:MULTISPECIES: N-acetylmuramic acid 6-phosphate etherase [Pelosinus]|uniref:N-acetylmuramic acid 6-phosphate etherase n=1 Tax=Pelosinus fermentans B4 TaxID=1149862 RepID=I8RJY5_9FIRM|nr:MULTISPECIES: N-acetylmuramic acid 6-phosphate etherase [Pelosinus]EIW20388.1 glucokinase regulatory-like protein [Pelosinus fermentans B4]EIW25553.1 N-acetylmuramic acid 6-phosphate etherase [Pelosinus fermentans A11]OAM93275.1 N-acetylmuramic acid 6-phosphate etherase [Pelosinus fermentans DSM 17108]SDQ72431.1 N-acetylmuramic acid 6-phosphate etherase [Pelosinus fermentans]